MQDRDPEATSMPPPLSPYPLPLPWKKRKKQVKVFKNNLVAGFVQEQ